MKKNKSYEQKITHSCSHCSSTFTLRETHLKLKGKVICANSCLTKWEELLNKHYQEKILGSELEQKEENNDDYGNQQ